MCRPVFILSRLFLKLGHSSVIRSAPIPIITNQGCLKIAAKISGQLISGGSSMRPMSSDAKYKGDIGLRTFGSDIEVTNDEEILATNDDMIFEREFAELTVESFADIHRGDKTVKEKIATILSEYEHIKYDSIGRVPSNISSIDMRQLLEDGQTPTHRAKLIHYMFKREMDKRQTMRRKQRAKELIRVRREEKLKEFESRSVKRSGLLTEEGELMYGLWHNSLFARIPENKIKNGLSNSRLNAAALFGRKLIFDFGLDEYMLKHNCKNTAEQVTEAYGINRFDYLEPFDFWFCNFNEEDITASFLNNKSLKNLHQNSMVTVKPDCMTNHFDKSQLVYLTPNAKDKLGQVVKSDDIYIIGCLNDKGTSQPVTMRKANMLGIRTRSLPLDDHIVWQGPNKSLCVNHVVGILLEVMSNGNDWHKAFLKYIPPRKIKPMEQILQEQERRLGRMKKKKATFSLRLDLD